MQSGFYFHSFLNANQAFYVKFKRINKQVAEKQHDFMNIANSNRRAMNTQTVLLIDAHKKTFFPPFSSFFSAFFICQMINDLQFALNARKIAHYFEHNQ